MFYRTFKIEVFLKKNFSAVYTLAGVLLASSLNVYRAVRV